MKKILILEAYSNQALAIAKHIKAYSHFYVVGAIEHERKFLRQHYDTVIVQNYTSIDKDTYSYILPMGADDTYRFLSQHQILHYHNHIAFSHSNLRVFDKSKMLQLADGLKVPVPKSYYDQSKIKHFPIFYKEGFEKGGGTRGIAYQANEIPPGKGLLYQEYIATPSTYGVAFLAKDGHILTYTTHKEVISYPTTGGSSVVIEAYEDERLLIYTQKLLKALEYNGWGLAEYKYCDKKEDFVFMEINAKFWASIEFMLRNDPQFLDYLLGIKYSKKVTQRILFINRLLKYKLFDLLGNLYHILDSTIVKESNLSYQLLRKFIPNIFIRLLQKARK